jgi:hypothetical protein
MKLSGKQQKKQAGQAGIGKMAGKLSRPSHS